MRVFTMLVLLLATSTVLALGGGVPTPLGGAQRTQDQNLDTTSGDSSSLSAPSSSHEAPLPDLNINIDSNMTLTGRRFGTVTILQGTTASITLDDCLVKTIVVDNAFAGVLFVYRTTVRDHVTIGSINAGHISISHSIVGSLSKTQCAIDVDQEMAAGSSFTLSHSTIYSNEAGLRFVNPTHGSVAISDSAFTIHATASRYHVQAVSLPSDIFGPISITNTTMECATTQLSNAPVTALNIARPRNSVFVHNVSTHVLGAPEDSTLTGVTVQTVQPTACVYLSNVSITVQSLSAVAESPRSSTSVFGVSVEKVLGALAVMDSVIHTNATRTSAAISLDGVHRSAVVLRGLTLTATRSPNSTDRVTVNALSIEGDNDGFIVVDDSELSAPNGTCVSLPHELFDLIGTVDLRGVRLSSCETNVVHHDSFTSAKVEQNCVWLGSNDTATETPLGYLPATTVVPCVGNTPRNTTIEMTDTIDLGLSQCASNSWSMAPMRPPTITKVAGNFTAENEVFDFLEITNPGAVKLVNVTASGISFSGLSGGGEALSSSIHAVSLAASATVSTSGPTVSAIHHVRIDGSLIGVGGITFDETLPTQRLRLAVTNTRFTSQPTASQPNVGFPLALVDSTLLFENVTIVSGAAECVSTQKITRSTILFNNVSFTKRHWEYWTNHLNTIDAAVAFNNDIDQSTLQFSGCRFNLSLPWQARQSTTLVAIVVGYWQIPGSMTNSQLHVDESSVMMLFEGSSKFLWSSLRLVQSCVTFDKSELSIRCGDEDPPEARRCKSDTTSVGFSFAGIPTNPSYITLSSLSVAMTADAAKVVVIKQLTNLDVVLNNLTVNVHSLRSPPANLVTVIQEMSDAVLAVTDSSIWMDNGVGFALPRAWSPYTYVSILLMNTKWSIRFAILEPASTKYLNVKKGCTSSGPGEEIPCDETSNWAQSPCSTDTDVYRALGIDKDRRYSHDTPAPAPGPDSPDIGKIMMVAGPVAFVVLFSIVGLSVLYVLRKRSNRASPSHMPFEEEMPDTGMAINEEDEVKIRNAQATSESAPLVVNRGEAA